jgi:hypothetical protein
MTTVTTHADTNLAFAHLDALGRVTVLHRIRRFTPRPGITDPQDNLNACIWGDVTRSGTTTVEFPSLAFQRTALLDRIPTNETTFLLTAAYPDHLQVTPSADLPGMTCKPVRSRHCMLIPPCMVGQFLQATSSPEGLSPRDLWERIAAPFADDKELREDCAPFIDWCRIAYTGGIALIWPAPCRRRAGCGQANFCRALPRGDTTNNRYSQNRLANAVVFLPFLPVATCSYHAPAGLTSDGPTPNHIGRGSEAGRRLSVPEETPLYRPCGATRGHTQCSNQ